MVLVWIANLGAVWFVVAAARSMVRQRRRTKARQRTRDLVVSPLAGLAVGAMFLGLQEIVAPQARHMIVEELKEDQLDDDEEEPLGGRLFYEQIRRIRRGEDVAEVTVKVPSAEPLEPI